jgi:hypothetical protein
MPGIFPPPFDRSGLPRAELVVQVVKLPGENARLLFVGCPRTARPLRSGDDE